MERHLHRIHPALGMLYGMSQNRREAQGNTQGGGLMSSLLGGLAGGVGAAGVGAMGKGIGGFKGMGKNVGANALKIGTSRIPILGAGIAGISEGLDSGSVGKGLATFAGALTGSALLGAAAGAVFGPVGAIVGAIIGNTLGMLAAKDIFNVLNSKNTVEKGTPRNPDRNSPNVEQIKPKGYGRLASLNSPQNAQSASGTIRKSGDAESEFLNFISSKEAEDYNTVYGGGKAHLTNMTLEEVMQFQDNKSNFANNGASRGVGKYQFTRKPLKEEIEKSGLDPKTTKFTQEVQDKLIMQRLKSARGYDDFISGKITREEFGNNLSEELASLPVLSNFKGKKRGQSRYDGDGLNKSHIKPGDFENAIDKLQQSKSASIKAPPRVTSLQDSTNRMQQKQMEDKSKPINVVTVGGSTGGSSTNISNTYVNPVNTDSTIRQLAQNIMYPARMV